MNSSSTWSTPFDENDNKVMQTKEVVLNLQVVIVFFIINDKAPPAYTSTHREWQQNPKAFLNTLRSLLDYFISCINKTHPIITLEPRNAFNRQYKQNQKCIVSHIYQTITLYFSQLYQAQKDFNIQTADHNPIYRHIQKFNFSLIYKCALGIFILKIMKLVKFKYPFIELMSYLEYEHSQALLYKLSKKFRCRLIKAYEFLQQWRESSSTARLFIDSYIDKQGNAIISNQEMQNLEAQSNKNLDLEILLKGRINLPKGGINLLKNNTRKRFGRVSITIITTIQTLLDNGSAIFAIFKGFFCFSYAVAFNLDLVMQNEIKQTINLRNSLIETIELLNLSSNDQILLNVQCLLKIKRLIINYYDQYNLKFQDLNIPFTNTKFTINFYSMPDLDKVTKAY